MPGKDVGSSKRPRPAWLIGQGRLLVFTAFVLAVVVAAGAATGPAHAADPAASTPAEDAATWNPGVVTYLVDNGGCHTAQIASIDTATPAIADQVSAAMDAGSVKVANFSSDDPDVKVVEINNVQKDGTHIAFMIDGWLSNTACAQATNTPTQQTSFTTGHTAGAAGAAATTPRVLGTVNLSDRHQVALMSAFTWFKQALKVVAVAVAYAAVVELTLVAIGAIVAGGGTAFAVAAQSALAGCIALGATHLIAARILTPDTTSTARSQIAVAARGCLMGAAGGGIAAENFGPALAAVVRRRLNTTPAIMGDSDLAAAQQAGVDVTSLANLVDGVADGALQATQ